MKRKQADRQKSPGREADSSNAITYGAGIGVALGTGLGVALGNVGLGIALGISLGAAIGLTCSQVKKE